MLNVDCVSKKYKHPDIVALTQVTLSVEKGEVVGLLGPNGAGKTTLVKIINGLVLPEAGNVSINGSPIRRASDVAPLIGSVFDSERHLYWGLTVQQNLLYFAQLKGANPRDLTDRLRRLAEVLRLEDLWKRRVATLSHGQKQRAAIAAALAHNPQLLILDEPTNGLDVENTGILVQAIRALSNQNTAILLSSHNLSFVQEVANRVYFIRQGRTVGPVDVNEATLGNDQSVYTFEVTRKLDAKPLSLAYANLIEWQGDNLLLEVLPGASVSQVIEELRELGYIVARMQRVQHSLHDLYRQILAGSILGGEVDNDEVVSGL